LHEGHLRGEPHLRRSRRARNDGPALRFTGLGSSEGEFANTGFSSNVDDLVAAAGHLRDTGRAPALLIGHSLGGAAVIAAAERIPESRAVATIGAPFDAAHILGHFTESVPEIEARGEAQVRLAGRPFTIRRSFIEDARAQDQSARLAHLGRALLVFHAPLDATVGIENARAIFEAARHPKSFVSLDDADHLLSDHADATYVAEVLAAWASSLSRGRPRASGSSCLNREPSRWRGAASASLAKPCGSARTSSRPTNRSRRAAWRRGRRPTTSCSRVSAPARP
jgi:putative redox protein